MDSIQYLLLLCSPMASNLSMYTKVLYRVKHSWIATTRQFNYLMQSISYSGGTFYYSKQYAPKKENLENPRKYNRIQNRSGSVGLLRNKINRPMDKCVGGELMESVPKSQKAFVEVQVRDIMVKIIGAVAYIHEQGIIHRDIKPENIMFSDRDIRSEPKLIDFGLSVKYDAFSYNKLKPGVGTPVYLAPEVINGTYNEKCDVWSLGVLLFTTLIGYPHFYGRNRQELYDNIQFQNLIFDRRHWRNISDEAKDLLKRMLNKNPDLRYSTKDCLKHPWFSLPFKEGVYRPPRRSTGFSNTASEDDQKGHYIRC